MSNHRGDTREDTSTSNTHRHQLQVVPRVELVHNHQRMVEKHLLRTPRPLQAMRHVPHQRVLVDLERHRRPPRRLSCRATERPSDRATNRATE